MVGPDPDASPVAWAASQRRRHRVLVLILFVGVLNRKREPVMLYMRNVRFTIMGVNMLLLGFVETARIADRRLNLAVAAVGEGVRPGVFRQVRGGGRVQSRAPLWPGCGPRTKLALRRVFAARHAAVRARRTTECGRCEETLGRAGLREELDDGDDRGTGCSSSDGGRRTV